jgi:hypothetical protein
MTSAFLFVKLTWSAGGFGLRVGGLQVGELQIGASQIVGVGQRFASKRPNLVQAVASGAGTIETARAAAKQLCPP